MSELFLSFSISFTLLFIFGGLINIVLLKSNAGAGLIKGLVGIQTLILVLVLQLLP
jgi:hypothetical protein